MHKLYSKPSSFQQINTENNQRSAGMCACVCAYGIMQMLGLLCHRGPHPEGVSLERSKHSNKERLLQQSKHGTDQGLESGQSAKVVGRIAEKHK